MIPELQHGQEKLSVMFQKLKMMCGGQAKHKKDGVCVCIFRLILFCLPCLCVMYNQTSSFTPLCYFMKYVHLCGIYSPVLSLCLLDYYGMHIVYNSGF